MAPIFDACGVRGSMLPSRGILFYSGLIAPVLIDRHSATVLGPFQRLHGPMLDSMIRAMIHSLEP